MTVSTGILTALELAQAALLLVEEAQKAGEDVTPEQLAGLRQRLDAKIDAFDAKLKADGH